MPRDFQQIPWDVAIDEDCRELVRLAVREDLERELDWTTVALVPPERTGAARIVAREPGILAGMQALEVAIDEMAAGIALEANKSDGERFQAGQSLGRLTGNVRDLLTCERILLNLLGRLTGIATVTGQYVALLEGSRSCVYDTRKTTPGWRRLEKYAVRCGGGRNHRTGLYDAILIKDNHLAQFASEGQTPAQVAAGAVREVRRFLAEGASSGLTTSDLIIEVEVDSLEQLQAVLTERPDIVLLDNMAPETLREAVALRNQMAPVVELEASGGVRLDSIRAIAEAGVERISVGALTHGARSLDVGLDWED